jgi:uracil-DNA glycosylase family 4
MPHDLRSYYLKQMGIVPWVLRRNISHQKKLAALAVDVSHCVSCSLHQTRKQTVFARGNPNAPLMIIGDAPGFDENEHGAAFIGKAGGLLQKMLGVIDCSDEKVYMTHVLKCCPPHQRDPQQEEIATCRGYLLQQIDLVSPRVILAVGRFSGPCLLNTTESFDDLRQRIHHYHGRPLLVSYHPRDLLRHPEDKKKAYDDWLQLKQLLADI